MSETITASFIALFGVMVGVFIRDIVIGVYQFNRTRQNQVKDQNRSFEEQLAIESREREQRRHDTVRLYADPLYQSVRSLVFRLNEILEHPGRAAYLLPEAPETIFNTYKLVSTLYRLAAVLGWIRAFRKER